jgi:GT2 family glycosyltransferase
LSTLVAQLLHDPSFRAAYSGRELVLSSGGREVSLGDRFEAYSRSLLENRNIIDLSGLVQYRSDVIAAGGFKEELSRFIDWEMILQVTAERAPIGIPESLFCYQISPDNHQISYSENRIENERIIQRSLAAKPLALPYPCEKITGGYALYSNVAPPKVESRRPVSVVIPNWEVPECLRVCLDALEKFSAGHDYEIIIVDNDSQSPQTHRLLDQVEAEGRATVVRNKENFGFTYAVNQGIKRAGEGRDLILFNNDAIATEGWLDGFMLALETVPEAALIAPREVVLPGHKFAKTHVPACNPDREIDVMLSRHHDNVLPSPAHPGGIRNLKFAPFFCVYLPRSTFDEFGYLDHVAGRHYKSDRLYCAEILKRGKRMIYTPHSKVYHLGQQATTVLKAEADQFETMFVRNEWGDSEVPGAID